MRRTMVLVALWCCLSFMLLIGCGPLERDFTGSSTGAGGTGSQTATICRLGSLKIGDCQVQ